MAKIIAWDIERFDEVIARIESCIQVLEEQEGTITKLRETVAGNWVSDAGREYAERIDEDLKNLGDILEKFRDTRKDIEEAERKYAGGELDAQLLKLDASLINLGGSIALAKYVGLNMKQFGAVETNQICGIVHCSIRNHPSGISEFLQILLIYCQ